MRRLFTLLSLTAFGLTGVLSGCGTPSAPSIEATVPVTSFAPLPEPITSFGAVTDGRYLYAFGGHKGERHEYCVEMVSGSFERLDLNDGRSWEPLPSSTPGQGLPLVIYNNSVYRIGGMAARNHSGTKQDLYSTSVVQRYDASKRQWLDLTPLPFPRSSHDAVVLGGRLYVFGGWQLEGGTNKPGWPSNGMVLDLHDRREGWKPIPQPFQRRALALAALGSRVFCIGGMDSDNEPSLSVEIYDTVTGAWSKGPSLPAGKHKGFGCSAIRQNGQIYASAFQGDLLRLSTDAQSWEVAGRLEHPRMAHRLVTAGETQLIALGGEDGESKRPDLELLTPRSSVPLAEQHVTLR